MSVGGFILLCVIFYLIFFRKSKKSKKSRKVKLTTRYVDKASADSTINGLEPEVFYRQQEADRVAVFASMGKEFAESPYFRKDKVPELMRRISTTDSTFPFFGEPLPLEKKKELHLPTRNKIPADVLVFFTEEGLQGDFLKIIYNTKHKYSNIFHRRRTLESLQRAECTKINVLSCPYYKDKVFPINEPPCLPCPDCTKPFCNCDFGPVEFK